MNKLLATTSAVAMSLVAVQAHADMAQRWPNWYVGVTGGVTFLSDTDIKGSASGKASYETGGNAAVSLGYEPPATMQPFSNMRAEAELGYHYNSIDRLTVGGVSSSSGSSRMLSYMGNLYYDFRNTSSWTPYIGGGAGDARVNISKTAGLGNDSSADNVFAYQFMAGISYAPSTLPNTEWSLGYRYFATANPEFTTPTGSVKLDDERAQSAEVGAKFRF